MLLYAEECHPLPRFSYDAFQLPIIFRRPPILCRDGVGGACLAVCLFEAIPPSGEGQHGSWIRVACEYNQGGVLR